MSALLVSEVLTRRDYWRNTAVTPTKIQSSRRRIFVDRSYHIGPFLVGINGNPKVIQTGLAEITGDILEPDFGLGRRMPSG